MLLEHCLIRLWNFGAQARCIKGDGRVEMVYFEPGRFSLWPWNENARTKQKQQTNGNRAIGLVIERIQTRMAFGWWSERSRNRYFALTSYCNATGQSNNAFSISGLFFGGKTKSPCFDLFIHRLIKQITNTSQNRFSRSCENRCGTILGDDNVQPCNSQFKKRRHLYLGMEITLAIRATRPMLS